MCEGLTSCVGCATLGGPPVGRVSRNGGVLKEDTVRVLVRHLAHDRVMLSQELDRHGRRDGDDDNGKPAGLFYQRRLCQAMSRLDAAGVDLRGVVR